LTNTTRSFSSSNRIRPQRPLIQQPETNLGFLATVGIEFSLSALVLGHHWLFTWFTSSITKSSTRMFIRETKFLLTTKISHFAKLTTKFIQVPTYYSKFLSFHQNNSLTRTPLPANKRVVASVEVLTMDSMPTNFKSRVMDESIFNDMASTKSRRSVSSLRSCDLRPKPVPSLSNFTKKMTAKHPVSGQGRQNISKVQQKLRSSK